MPFDQLPRFNWDGPSGWPPRRRILNRMAPLLFVPYVPLVFLTNIARERSVYSWRENLRMSLGQGIYAGMVQYYVAKYQYLRGPSRAPSLEAPRPGAASPGGEPQQREPSLD